MQIVSGDDRKLCWELTGATGLRACLKRAWHGHPGIETEDTSDRPLDMSTSNVRGQSQSFRVRKTSISIVKLFARREAP